MVTFKAVAALDHSGASALQCPHLKRNTSKIVTQEGYRAKKNRDKR